MMVVVARGLVDSALCSTRQSRISFSTDQPVHSFVTAVQNQGHTLCEYDDKNVSEDRTGRPSDPL